MYVDEVGNPGTKNIDESINRFLSLTGVILSLDTVKEQFHSDFEELKYKYFDHHPDEPIIFHRKELMNGVADFRTLKNQKIRERFDRELLSIIAKTDFSLLTVVLDKQKYREQYGKLEYDPYHYCMETILMRYIVYLEKNQLRGDVFAEARGGKEDRRLKDEFKNLCNNGNKHINVENLNRVLTSKELKVKPKWANISGLQLADLLAHPSRREILIDYNNKDDNRANLFADKIVEILKGKYYKEEGKVFGAGKVLIP